MPVRNWAPFLLATALLGACREGVQPLRICVLPAEPTTTDSPRVELSVALDSPRYRWFRDGQRVDGIGEAALPAALTSRDERWRVEVTGTDERAREQRAEAWFTIHDSPPALLAVEIQPSDPDTTASLQALVSSHDDDGDAVSVHYRWTADGALLQEGASDTLAAALTVKHAHIAVEATPSDGQAQGGTLRSPSVTVRNSAPSIEAAQLSEEQLFEASVLECLAQGWRDDDDDPQQLITSWMVNGREVSRAPSIDGGLFDKGDSVACTLTPSDGEAEGVPRSSEGLTVLNSPPALSVLQIEPREPTVRDALTLVAADLADDDGDPVELAFTWWVDGAEVSRGETIDGGLFAKGQTVQAGVVARDSEGAEAELRSEPVLVADAPPEILELWLEPTAPGTDDLVQVHAETWDPDGDSVGFTATWTVDGVSAASSDTIDGGSSFERGQHLEVTVRPSDGELSGATASASVVVANTAPSVATATVSPSEPAEASTLSCDPDGWVDPDGDSASYATSWSVDGLEVSSAGSIDGALFDRDQTVSCALIPDDGIDEGDPVFSEPVTVQNTPPRIGAARLAGSIFTRADPPSLELIDLEDDDDDEIGVLVDWWVSGASSGEGSMVLGAQHFARGDLVWAIVTPVDHQDEGASARTGGAVIQNSPPVITALELSEDLLYADTTIDAEVVVEDLDDDAPAVTVDWFLNGALLVEDQVTLEGEGLLSRGDLLYAVASPSDGIDDGSPETSATLEVLNSPPTAPEIQVDPPVVVQGEGDLVCRVTQDSTDADGDPISYLVTWQVDGHGYTATSDDSGTGDTAWLGPSTTTISGDTIPAEAVSAGETWTCRVTPDDGLEAGERAELDAYVVDPASPAAVFTGPIIGAVSDSSAGVNLRMDDTTLVRVELCEDPDFEGYIHSSDEDWAIEASDWTAQLRVDGLSPDTLYHLRVLAADEVQALSTMPSFRTAPAAGSSVSFGFGLLADTATLDALEAPAYQALGAMDPDFVIQLGDLDHRDPATVAAGDIRAWRAMHRETLGGNTAGQALAAHILVDTPFFHTWDDHDYGENNAVGGQPWAGNALQAYYEYFPVPAAMPNPRAGIWYSFRWAQLEVFMLDDRSQRCLGDEAASVAPSMLDCFLIEDDQKSWLLQGLLDSTATWKLIVSGSCWNPAGKQTDSWAEHPIEWHQILDFIDDNGITGVFVASGDIHSGGGIDDGTNSGIPELTVPTTNAETDVCTGGSCGTWSVAVREGFPAGFGWIEISSEAGLETLELRTYGSDGSARLSWSTTLP